MTLKPMVLAVRQALAEIGEAWLRGEWHRQHECKPEAV